MNAYAQNRPINSIIRLTLITSIVLSALSGFSQETSPKLVIQTPHPNNLEYITTSPKGTYLATGDQEGLIKIWDVKSRKLITTLEGHKQRIRELRFSDDESVLFSKASDFNFPDSSRVWDWASGTFGKADPRAYISLKNTEWRPFTLNHGGQSFLTLINQQNESKQPINLDGYVYRARHYTSENSNFVVLGLVEKGVYIYDALTLDLIKKFEVEIRLASPVIEFDYDAKRERLLVHNHKELLIINTNNFEQVYQLKPKYPKKDARGLYQARLNKTESWVGVVFSKEHIIQIWDYENDRKVWQEEKIKPRKFTFVPNEKDIIYYSNYLTELENIHYYDWTQQKKIRFHKVCDDDDASCQQFKEHGLTADGSIVAFKGEQFSYWDNQWLRKHALEYNINPEVFIGFKPKRGDFYYYDPIHTYFSYSTGKFISLNKNDNNQAFIHQYNLTNGTKERIQIFDKDEWHLFNIGAVLPNKWYLLWNLKGSKYQYLFYDQRGNQRHKLKFQFQLDHCSFSNNGKYFAYLDNDTNDIDVVDLEKKDKVYSFDPDYYTDEVPPIITNQGQFYFIYSHELRDKRIKCINVNSGLVSFEYSYESLQSIRSWLMSTDGTQIFLGYADGKLEVIDAQNGELIKSLKMHETQITQITQTGDGERVMTYSADDKSAKVIDTNNWTTLISMTGNVIINDEGYYAVEKGSGDEIGFRYNSRAYSFDNFDLKYNRPDKILQSYNPQSTDAIKLYKKAWTKRVAKSGVSLHLLDNGIGSLPVIRITNDNIPPSTTSPNLSLSVQLSDDEKNLKSLQITNNGVPIFGSKGTPIPNQKEYEGEFTIPLVSGPNEIQAFCLNENGLSSLRESVQISYNPVDVSKPDLYIISIGVSKYQDSSFNLSYAAKDAKDVIEAFSQLETYENVKSMEILDGDATTEKILAAKSLLKQTKVDDHVVLFVASHGLLDEELDYYIGTSDINFSNPSEGGLSYDALEGLLDGIPAMRKLMLIDACHSGEIDEEEVITLSEEVTSSDQRISFRGFKSYRNREHMIGLPNSFELMKELFSDLSNSTGAVVISSAGGVEFAIESELWNNGVFTYAVLEALSEDVADENKDRQTTVSELQTYVFEKVKTLTNGQQNPTTREENILNDFVIWDNR